MLWFWTSNHIIAGHVTIALRRFPWACVRSIDMPTGTNDVVLVRSTRG